MRSNRKNSRAGALSVLCTRVFIRDSVPEHYRRRRLTATSRTTVSLWLVVQPILVLPASGPMLSKTSTVDVIAGMFVADSGGVKTLTQGWYSSRLVSRKGRSADLRSKEAACPPTTL